MVLLDSEVKHSQSAYMLSKNIRVNLRSDMA